jgi:hypothetical protein
VVLLFCFYTRRKSNSRITKKIKPRIYKKIV